MATHEQQNEGVVTVRRDVVGAIWIPDLGWRPLGHPLLSASTRLVRPQQVGEPARRRSDEPSLWIRRSAVSRPLHYGCEQGFLSGVLCQVEVAVATDERAETLAREMAQQVLGLCLGQD